MIYLCKKDWEYQAFSLIHNIYYNKYNTVWSIKFIVHKILLSEHTNLREISADTGR